MRVQPCKRTALLFSAAIACFAGMQACNCASAYAADLGSRSQLKTHNVVVCTVFDHLTCNSGDDIMSCGDSVYDSK